MKTLDVAKRLLDFGVHAPTVYFPLIVEEALMIEPTETETLDRLDHFADVMLKIAEEARDTPSQLLDAPFTTPSRRLDEGRAARELKLRWTPRAAPRFGAGAGRTPMSVGSRARASPGGRSRGRGRATGGVVVQSVA